MTKRASGKTILVDWNFVAGLSDDELCYRLTRQQAALLLAYLEYARWPTRWKNAPDTDTIEAFADGLANQLLMPEVCAAEGSLMDVRANPMNPCILEKSDDGGATWVQFADVSTCGAVGPQGEPGEKGDTGDIGPVGPPGIDGADGVCPDCDDDVPDTPDDIQDRCAAAFGVEDGLQQDMVAALDQIEGAPQYLPPTWALGYVSERGLPIARFNALAVWVSDNYIPFAFQPEVDDHQARLINAADRDAMREAIYCAMPDDGIVDDAVLAAISAGIIALEDGDGYFTSAGELVAALGLQRIRFHALVGAVQFTAEDCSGFSCGTWCYTWDFTTGAAPGWNIPQGNPTAGVGIRHVSAANPLPGGVGFSRSVYMNIDLPATPITEIEIVFERTSAGGAIGRSWSVGQEENGDFVQASNFDNGTLTKTGAFADVPMTNIQIFARSDYDGSSINGLGGSVTMLSCTIKGTGTNPFGADNCS